MKRCVCIMTSACGASRSQNAATVAVWHGARDEWCPVSRRAAYDRKIKRRQRLESSAVESPKFS